ncbi:MAG: histidine phosphatase family protein [Candidatus Riflebacteria bacterium]|nr:histidine phosphatase family protein [Candidatus Riflebacteria bacterium]
MNRNREWLLIRNPEPASIKGLCYGWTDVKLEAGWESSVKKFNSRFPDTIDQIISSPLQRCLLPAQLLHKMRFGENSSNKLTVDDRLKEMNFGIWEDHRWIEIPREEIDAWAYSTNTYKIPGGESLVEFGKRVTDWFKQIYVTSRAKKTAVFTHAGVIRVLAGKIRNTPPDKILQMHIGFGQTCVIRETEKVLEVVEIK